jgi:hypothetical protein
MQKIKNAIKGHRHGREDEFDVSYTAFNLLWSVTTARDAPRAL